MTAGWLIDVRCWSESMVALTLIFLLGLFVSPLVKAEDAISEAIIKHVNHMKTSWTAGHNLHFKGRDIEFAKGLCGVRPQKENPNPPLPVADIEPLRDIPATFDARTQWPNCTSIRLIRDQGACGSCWAFGAVEAFSDRFCVFYGENVEISAEELNSCCEFCGSGCDGGFPQEAWRFFERDGCVSGGLYGDKTTCEPYELPPCSHHEPGKYPDCGSIKPTPKCQKVCVNSQISFNTDRHYAMDAYSVRSNVEEIQTEIMKYGPVEAAFSVYKDFITYKSGVYVHTTGSFLGGHAVKILGWGEESGMPYWLVANSWNQYWGDEGYFKIVRGRDECGIESSIVAGKPKKF